MAVNFIIEDGSGVESSNAYCSVIEFIQYWENRGNNYTSCKPETIEAAIIAATEKIDQNYNFLGYPVSYDQSLKWPRFGMINCNGKSIDSDEIPTELKNAVCQMAAYIKDNGDPDLEESGISQKSIGPISVTYTNGGQVKMKTVDKALKCFLKYGYHSVRV